MRFEPWRQDLRLASHGLLRAKAFAATAVLTLALGIGATTAMFALIEGVLLRPLPVPEQGRLIVAWKALSSDAAHWPFVASDIDVIGKESRTLESVAGVSYYEHPSPFATVEDGVPSSISGAAVTGEFFRVLGATPILGRVLNRADDVQGAENVLVITHGLWQRRYGGTRDVIGRRVMVRERPFVVVGVMPPNVECPHGVEAWMTLAASASTMTNPGHDAVLRDVDLFARLRPGATIEQARSELLGLASRLEADASPDALRGWTPGVRSYEDLVVGAVRPALLVLFGAVGLVLLIASANAANLLLLRGEARRPELAVRAALGAGPGRMVRELLAESLLLSLAAGVVGMAVTWWTLHALVALVPDGLTRVESVRVDVRVLLFAVAVAFLAAALAGLVPAMSLARADLVAHLRSGGRGTTGNAARQGRRALVVAQVALAVTVVAAAGLLTRSLLRLQGVDMGLAADRLVLVRLALPQAKYADDARHLRLLEELVAELEAAPGISGATPVNAPPFAGTGGWDAPEFAAEGQSPEAAATNPSLNLEAIHPNYFQTLEVTLVRGRGFTQADRGGAPEVAVVSENVAAHAWPGEEPIGKRIKLGRLGSTEGWKGWRTVVGVARATRYRELAAPRATLYLPAEQFIVAADMFVLRAASPLSLVAGLTRERVRAVDPEVQVLSVAPFRDLLQGPLARPRFNAFLIGVFGIAALLLAAIGLYAVMAASVRQRFKEIGVRMALGATASDVRGLVLGEGLRLALMGAAIGLTGAWMVTRLLRGLLYGVHPLDPASLLAAALLLVAVSGLASYLPARRAARVDPVSMLRAE
jgi:putative ABC transport system permease protein